MWRPPGTLALRCPPASRRPSSRRTVGRRARGWSVGLPDGWTVERARRRAGGRVCGWTLRRAGGGWVGGLAGGWSGGCAGGWAGGRADGRADAMVGQWSGPGRRARGRPGRSAGGRSGGRAGGQADGGVVGALGGIRFDRPATHEFGRLWLDVVSLFGRSSWGRSGVHLGSTWGVDLRVDPGPIQGRIVEDDPRPNLGRFLVRGRLCVDSGSSRRRSIRVRFGADQGVLRGWQRLFRRTHRSSKRSPDDNADRLGRC